MSDPKKVLKKGTKVRIAEDYGAVGEPLAVVVDGIPKLTHPRRIREDYEYFVYFLTPSYDIDSQGPFAGAIVDSQYMTPIGHQNPLRSEAARRRYSLPRTDPGYIYNLPDSIHKAQVAMVKKYDTVVQGKCKRGDVVVTLSTDERRDLLGEVIEAAQSIRQKCTEAVEELQRHPETGTTNSEDGPGNVLAAQVVFTVADRRYALQESIKINDFFENYARKDLAEMVGAGK